MQKAPLSSPYRADIDGLRALAVTAVVLFHAGVPGFGSGFVGVDIFFVISGYLIGGIIAREAGQGRFSFAGFYARRARRILPALIGVVLVACAAGAVLLDAAEFRGLGATAASTLLAVSNISFWHYQDYFAADAKLSPLLMSWSLGVEEQFYFCFPLLVIAVLRLAPRRLLPVVGGITVMSFCFSLWATWRQPAIAYYLLPARAWELGAGVLLAIQETERRAAGQAVQYPPFWRELCGWGGLAAVLTGIVGFDEHTPFPGVMALLPVIGAVALIAAQGACINRRLLAARPVVFVGLISYSWYLWHWPIFSFLRILFFNWTPAPVLIAAIPVSFVGAVLSWRFIEQPFRHARLPAGPTLRRYGAALLAALLLPLIIKYGEGLPQRLNPQTKAIEQLVTAGRGNCLAPFTAAMPDISPACVVEPPSRPTLALIGDSHAAALGFGLRALAARQQAGIAIFTKSSCPPLAGVTVDNPAQPALAASCARFMTDVLARVAADPAVTTVYLAGDWLASVGETGQMYQSAARQSVTNKASDPMQLLRSGLRQAVAQLRQAGKQVVVVGDTPHWLPDPVLADLATTIPARRWAAMALWRWSGEPLPASGGPGLVEADRQAPALMLQQDALAAGAATLNLFDQFCTAGRCRFIEDGQLLFIDTNHLSQAGSLAAFGLPSLSAGQPAGQPATLP